MNSRRLNHILTFIMALLLVLSLVTVAFAATTLKNGSKGDKVRLLQDALKSEGIFKGDIDGVYGDSTEEAVRVYQSKVGLPADGIAGEKTQKALYEGKVEANDLNNTALKQSIQAKNPRSMTYGMSGDRIAELQRALRKTGDYHGPTDGKYGSMTLNAVIRFQQRHNLKPDGIAGVATLAKLNAQPGVSKVSTGFEITPTSNSKMIKTMQQCLNAVMDYESTDPAGVFGASTKAQLIDWQKTYSPSKTDGVLSEGQYNLLLKQRQQKWAEASASTAAATSITESAAVEDVAASTDAAENESAADTTSSDQEAAATTTDASSKNGGTADKGSADTTTTTTTDPTKQDSEQTGTEDASKSSTATATE